MKKTTAPPKKTPSPNAETTPHKSVDEEARSPSLVFMSTALDMSWRLAIVVLLPIIGGFELDEKFDTSPLLTITGFLLAIGGIALVLKRMMQQVNQSVPQTKGKRS